MSNLCRSILAYTIISGSGKAAHARTLQKPMSSLPISIILLLHYILDTFPADFFFFFFCLEHKFSNLPKFKVGFFSRLSDLFLI